MNNLWIMGFMPLINKMDDYERTVYTNSWIDLLQSWFVPSWCVCCHTVIDEVQPDSPTLLETLQHKLQLP